MYPAPPVTRILMERFFPLISANLLANLNNRFKPHAACPSHSWVTHGRDLATFGTRSEPGSPVNSIDLEVTTVVYGH